MAKPDTDETCFSSDSLVNVASLLNEEFGDDVKNIIKAKQLSGKLERTIKSLENKVCLTTDDTSTPYKLAQVLQSAELALTSSQSLLDHCPDLISEIETHISQLGSLAGELKPEIDTINELEKYLIYLKWIECTVDLIERIQDAMKHESTYYKATKYYVKLTEMWQCAMNSSCLHLWKFIDETVCALKHNLFDVLSREFREILESMKWPFMQTSPGNLPLPTYDILLKFEYMFALLLDINIPIQHDPPCLPLYVLFHPFRLRFQYHFMSNRKTNCLSKPQWCYTQVLTWVQMHSGFLDMYIQPILNRLGQSDVNAKMSFMTFLNKLVIVKMEIDFKRAMHDEPTLAHIIQETLTYEKELRNWGYPVMDSSVLSVVLLQKECFLKWLKLEKELAIENMDKMFSTDTMWKPLCQDQNESGDNKVPECAEKFITMILSITDRYKYLQQDSHRLEFFNLQMELVDDLRVRLLQLLRIEATGPLSSNLCAILNGVFYIINVIKDWSDLPFFLKLQEYKRTLEARKNIWNSTVDGSTISSCITSTNNSDKKPSSSSADSSPTKTMEKENNLDTLARLFEHMKDEMLSTLTDYVVFEFKAKSYNYRHEKWFSLPSPKDYVTPSLSPTACEMFVILTSSLKCLHESLALPLFNRVWQGVAQQLNDFFYKEVILVNRFNEGGAAQFNYDMTRNLFPIFAEYTRRPDNYFKLIKQPCLLLTLSVGSALLLHETLISNTHKTENQQNDTKRLALEEIGVHTLSVQDAVNILKLRTDINIYLL